MRPLRTRASSAEQTLKARDRTGTPKSDRLGPGAGVFGGRGVTVHLFVLTLGYSRRSFYRAYPNEQLGAFLDRSSLRFLLYLCDYMEKSGIM